MNHLSLKDKISFFYNQSSKENMTLVEKFYHPDVIFVDPIEEIKGVKNLKRYYENLYKNVKTIQFDFSNFYEDQNTVIALWTMTFTTDKLNFGKPISVRGNSVIRFNSDGLATHHTDYYDMSEFLYEQIPFLGGLFRKFKQQLKVP